MAIEFHWRLKLKERKKERKKERNTLSGLAAWSYSVKLTVWEKGHLRRASYSPGRILM